MKKTKRPAARKAGGRKKAAVKRQARAGVKARSKRATKPAATPRASSLKKQYLEVFAREFPVTLKVMKAYPPGQDAFRPHDRSTSAVGLVHSFAAENGVVIKAVRGELTMPPDFPPAPATCAEAIASYERGARELMAAVEKMPESRMTETVTFFTGPGQMGPIPVGELLWLMLLDSVHHRGQLSVYIRMAGGKVPSIYGPSADEPWM